MYYIQQAIVGILMIGALGFCSGNSATPKDIPTPQSIPTLLNLATIGGVPSEIDSSNRDSLPTFQTLDTQILWDILILRHPMIRSIKAEIESMDAQYTQLDTHLRENPILEMLLSNRSFSPNQFDIEATLSGEYFLGYTFNAQLRQITLSKEQLKRELAAFQNRLFIELEYYVDRISVSMKSIEQLTTLRTTLDTLQKTVELQQSFGATSHMDYAMFKSNQNHLVNTVNYQQNILAAIKQELSIFLFYPPDTDLPNPVHETLLLPVPMEYADFFAQAITSRVEVNSLYTEIQISNEEIRLLRSERFPSLDWSIGYTFEEQDHRIGIGIGIPLPVFNQNRQAIKRQQLVTQSLCSKIQSLIQEIQLQVYQDYVGYTHLLKYLQDEIATVKPNVDAAQQAVSVAFTSGQITLPDLLIAQQRFTDFYLGYYENLLNFLEMRKKVQLSAGVPIFQTIQHNNRKPLTKEVP